VSQVFPSSIRRISFTRHCTWRIREKPSSIDCYSPCRADTPKKLRDVRNRYAVFPTPRPSRTNSTFPSRPGSALRHREVADCPGAADATDSKTCPCSLNPDPFHPMLFIPDSDCFFHGETHKVSTSIWGGSHVLLRQP